jgi:glycosyltransferase involved in cell wall biosynthesis
LVIPAYNEAARIRRALEESHRFLASRSYPTELIVADDGSTDDTAALARAFAAEHPSVRVLSIPHAGKAAAVRAGMKAARGALIAFSDADLATPLTYLDEFVRRSETGADVVIGSREGAGARRIDEPEYRHVMGRIFNRFVQLTVLPGIDDTQCGFKLFTGAAARNIMDAARLYRELKPASGARVTAFDVELLAIARRRGLRIDVVPVVWSYGTQSKVSPIRDTIRNVLDVAKVAVNLRLGRYG